MNLQSETERAKMLVDEINKRHHFLGNKHGRPIPAKEETRWLYEMRQIAEQHHAAMLQLNNGEIPAPPTAPDTTTTGEIESW